MIANMLMIGDMNNMTDLEKFKKLFDEVGIKYDIENYQDKVIWLTMKENYPHSYIGFSCTFNFHVDGNFDTYCVGEG
jgi:hypothetical protein